MQESVTKQENQQAEEGEMSDDPFASSDEEDTTDEIQQLLTRKLKPIVIKPAKKQSIIDWVDRAWKKIGSQQEMVAKSFIVTGIAQHLDCHEDTGIRNDDIQEEIIAGFEVEEDFSGDESSTSDDDDDDYDDDDNDV